MLGSILYSIPSDSSCDFRPSKCAPAIVTKIIYQTRRVPYKLLFAVDFAVNHTQRVLLEPLLTVLAKLADMRSEIILKDLVVLGAADRAADGINAKLNILKSHSLEIHIYYGNNLSVNARAFGAESLKTELMELSVSAFCIFSYRKAVIL